MSARMLGPLSYRAGSSAVTAVVLTTMFTLATGRAAACTGDCDGGGSVTINELVLGVAIALDNEPLSLCPAFDVDHSASVEISELVAAVGFALDGCPATETPTISPAPTTPSPTMTATMPAATPTQTAAPPTASQTATPVATATASSSPANTPTPSPSLSPTRTRTPTRTATVTPTLPEAAPVLIAGPELVVTSSPESNGAVCQTAGGGFVIAWASGGGIRARRYAPDGTSIGGEFPIQASGGTGTPAVSCAGDGSFVAVWQGSDASGAGIDARRLDSDGRPLGDSFAVNSYTTGDQTSPDVCGGADGDFTVIWQSEGQDGDSSGIFAQHYDFSGRRAGSEFQVNVGTTGAQRQPAIACNAAGESVAVWDNGSRNVGARRLGIGGAPQEFFNSMPSLNPPVPDVASDSDGNFVIVWEYDIPIASPQYPKVVAAQRYGRDGTGLGSLAVASQVGTTQGAPAITRGASGDFLVAWEGGEVRRCDGFCALGSCGNPEFPVCDGFMCCSAVVPPPGTHIFAQRYDASGATAGEQLAVSTANGSAPAVAGDPADTFMVVWNHGQLRARRYTQLVPQARGALAPCHGAADAWTFAVDAGQSIEVGVDTLDPATAADLCFQVDCGSFSFSGDDEAACRFAPSSFACPRNEMIAPASATCTVSVTTCSAVCADPLRASYALFATADGSPVALAFGGPLVEPTPTGTPKRPDRPPSERLHLDVSVYRSLNDKVYVVVLPVADRRTQITTVALSSDPVRFFYEQFDPAAMPIDLVLTSFAGTQGGNNLPLTGLFRTDVVSGLTAHPLASPPTFDPCANDGEGLLTFPSGQAVSYLGPAPNQPSAPAVVALANASSRVPAAVVKRIVRRAGQEVEMSEAIAFPAPPATCIGGLNPGIACSNDVACGAGGACGLTSQPPTCSGDPNLVCDPAEAGSCVLSGQCNHLGGEREGQSVTIDDTLDSTFGNPNAQPTGPDGFRLAGNCSEPGGCQVLVFLLDGAGLVTVNVAAAGFLLDTADLVVGTTAGIGQRSDGVMCSEPREFRANTQTSGAQEAPALCQTTGGDTVIAWDGRPGIGGGIGAQRFSRSGVALGGELSVNTSPDGTQAGAAICCGTDGGFVVAWSDSGADAGIFARRYGSDGQPLGDEFKLNTSANAAGDPAITCLANGGFFAAWLTTLAQDANGIDARYFTAAGAPRGDEIHISDVVAPPGFAPGPQLAFLTTCSGPDSNVVLAWTKRFNFEFTTAWQLLAPDGSLQDGGDTGHDDQHAHFEPAVACRPDGSYVLVDRLTTPCNAPPPFMCGADGSGDAVFFVGGGGRVNTSTLGDQGMPAVATDGAGNALVVWVSNSRDGGHPGIFGQRYTSAGVPLGVEFQLNADPSGSQSDPAVSCDARGECVAAWTAPDGSDTGIFVQRLPAPAE